MSNIRTTFRNLRDISGDKRIIDSSGETLANIITSKRPTILLFSLDTKAMKIQSAQVARMLIADLKQNDRIIREKNENAKLMCIFDEFGSFATEDIVELQEQGRSFGFEIIYSIQTLSNLTKISQDFATRIIGNCSTYITHRTRDNKAAEEIANLIATNPEFEGTMRHSQGEETGEESVREVQAFIHHPRMIKQIPDHHALVVTIQEGQVTPIKDPVKIDYADTENFISNQNAKHSAIEELTDFFRSEGLSNKEAAKLAYEKSYSLPISHINTMSERPVKAKFLTKDGNSKVQIEISKIQAMSDVE
jgi:type IV secretory pathway TraG/TraD family ATPase VirD4